MIYDYHFKEAFRLIEIPSPVLKLYLCRLKTGSF